MKSHSIRLRLRVVAVSLAAVFSVTASAQNSKLSSVKILGSKNYSETQIIPATGLTIGSAISKEDLQAAADRLSQLGPFHNVRFSFKSQGDNVAVTFELQDTALVPVSFDNFPWFSDEEIIAAIRAAVPMFSSFLPEQGTMLDEVVGCLNTLLATKKIKGTVEHSLLGRPGVEGMMLQFHVVGPALKISAIQFGHSLAAEDKRIATLSRELIGKPYSQFVAQLFAFEQIRPIYFEKGFLRAQFSAPQARFTGDPNKPLPDEVTLIFPIEPGHAYKWYGASWTGNTIYSTAALDVMTALVTNELADGMKIAAQWDHIRAEYGRKGFLDTTLETAPVFDETTGRVTYNVTIHEGPQYKMGELVLTGLSVAAERKLKEAWRLQRGELFDRVYFDEFYASGIKKLFEDTPVHFSEIGQWLRANPETKVVDVLLDFK